MKYTADELLLKETIEEMGLVWDETPGEITINGVSAVEFLENNNIFKSDSNYYFVESIDKTKQTGFKYNNQTRFKYNVQMSLAA